MNERRRSRRVEPPTEVVGLVKSTVPARVLDLSADGIQVEIARPLRPMVDCNFSLPTSAGPLELRARVHRCRAITLRPGERGEAAMVYRAGLSFIDLDDTRREQLEDAILDFTLSEAPTAAGNPDRRLKIQIHTDDDGNGD